MKINLSPWVDEQEKVLKLFVEDWVVRNKQDPAHYPLLLSAGEWDEQFHSFAEHYRDVEELKALSDHFNEKNKEITP